MKWWLKAAEQDHPLAQFNVGRAYYLGIGLKEDHAQSRLWFKRAAKNNEPKSIDILKQLNWSEPGEFKDSPIPDMSETQLATKAATPDKPEEIPPPTKPAQAERLAAQAITKERNKAKAQPTTTPAAQTPLVQAPLTQSNAPAMAAPRLNSTEKALVKKPAVEVQPNPALAQIQKSETLADNSNPIAVYTNPAKRSVLITILNDRKRLKVVNRAAEWTEVTSESGLPVWIHRDYIVVSDDLGAVQGNAVNARSVPLITSGTIVGRLNDNDTLAVIDKKNAWYRVISPRHFKAWVKTDDLYRKYTPDTQNAKPENQPADHRADTQQATAKITSQEPQTKPALALTSAPLVNDNAWLFSQPADGYTLQLASFDDPAKIAEFRSRPKFIDNPFLHQFTSSSKNVEWTYFLYGEYGSSETAKQARMKIKQDLAWVRSFGKLQQNRCLAWKKQLPTPKELNKYCS
jgi:hypothetical protein